MSTGRPSTSIKALKNAVADHTGVTERDRTLVSPLDKIESQYRPVAIAIVELAAAGNLDEAIKKIDTDCHPLLASLLAAVKDCISSRNEQAKLPTDLSDAVQRVAQGDLSPV